MNYYICTHGCQMNEHDSEEISYLLDGMGYSKVDSIDQADMVLINTCLIRQNAEDKVFGELGALKSWHEEKPGRILAVSGCMMQTGPARETIQKSYPQVDIIFGTQNIEKLPSLVEEFQATGKRVVDIAPKGREDVPFFNRANPYSAYVTVITGCNNFCSYCVVPYARGREQSRPPREILEEIKDLAQGPCREVVLLGQNVNSYGKDMGVTFPNLLRAVCQIDGIDRVRFISSHPKDLSDDLVEAIRENPKVERHFHLPLQSGSDKILKEMNRKYDRDHFLDLVDKLRTRVPGIAITTDIMVGFPGETEEDHQATLDLCRQAEFENAFTFIYSPRPGTKAAKRADQVPADVSSRRFQELLDVLYPIFYKKNRADIGKEVEVLFEGVSKNDDTMLSGRDFRFKLIHVHAPKECIGQIHRVRIIDGNSFSLIGELVD